MNFCEDKFSFANFSYNSLKAEGCSGEDVLVKFSQQVFENHKGVGMFQNLFTKRKWRFISSLDSRVALDFFLDIILSHL